MNRLLCAALAAMLFAAAPAHAKVAAQNESGFTLSYEAEIPKDSNAAFDAFIRIGEWWDPAHSYSGDGKNLTIDLKPGGCWCETLPDGGFVAHMRVAQSMPGKSLLFKGGLGPLAFMGVEGAMAVTFEAKGKAAAVKLNYAIGGHAPTGFKDLANGVDKVLGEAFKRYVNYASTGKP